MTGPTINRHRSKQDYSTPRIFIEAVEKRFGKIEFDLAADETNAKAKAYFGEVVDSLKQTWPAYDLLCWLNPPFSDITPWAKKCSEQAASGTRIMFLAPASIGSNWFRDYVWGKAKVIALNGRLTFEGATDPYPKDLMLSVYNPREGLDRPFEVWDWRGTEIRAL